MDLDLGSALAPRCDRQNKPRDANCDGRNGSPLAVLQMLLTAIYSCIRMQVSRDGDDIASGGRLYRMMRSPGAPDERGYRSHQTSLGLPARLPFGMRSRCRGDRGKADRPHPRRPRSDIYIRCNLRQSRPLLGRIHHPDRLTEPLRRTGPKGSGQFAPIGWDEALDRVAENFLAVEREIGPEGVWPYFYAGTMGLVMRDGIERLTHAKRYSRFHGTICVGIAWPGYVAGTGRLMGVDPREMAKSDCVVIWGTNAVATQVNVMTHAIRARKERGAKIVAIDIYETETMRQADLALCVRPGTDGALACAVMHVLFRAGAADWDYLERYTDAPHELEAHVRSRGPDWASAITGVSAAKIEEFAALVGGTKRTFFRLGYGFSRQRNGAANMHAALCIPAVTGLGRTRERRLPQR